MATVCVHCNDGEKQANFDATQTQILTIKNLHRIAYSDPLLVLLEFLADLYLEIKRFSIDFSKDFQTSIDV